MRGRFTRGPCTATKAYRIDLADSRAPENFVNGRGVNGSSEFVEEFEGNVDQLRIRDFFWQLSHF